MDVLPEDAIVGEARAVANRVVAWFRERLLASEGLRQKAEDQRAAADVQRRIAEDERAGADEQRAASDRRVIEVEQLLAVSEELAEQLQHALDSRIVIEQAKGMLAERHGVTPDVAFEALRSHARSNRAAIRDVAAGVVDGTAHVQA